MECTIPSRSIKLFVQVIQCLSRIGDYVNFETQETKLVLRTISESRSAFVSFSLDKSFYKEYRLLNNGGVGNVRVPLKPCLAVFRNINSIETCHMKLDIRDSKLIFNIEGKLGIKRVYKLFLEDSVVLQAMYNRSFPNKLSFKPGALLESLQNNFQSNLEEITMKVNRDHVVISSHVDETRSNANKVLRTELTLSYQEFIEFNARTPVELTFCFKELRAILTFCENAGQPVNLFYDRSGLPILLVLHFFNVVEADFVLATLLESDGLTDSQETSLDDLGSSQQSTPTGKTVSSSIPSSAYSDRSSSPQFSSLPSMIPKEEQEEPYAIPSSLTDFKINPTSTPDAMMAEISASGHVSGSDDESQPGDSVRILSGSGRRSRVFSTDFQSMDDDDSD